MGDRCYLTMTLRRTNLEDLVVHLGGRRVPEERNLIPIEREFTEVEDDTPEGICRITEYEANYAWYSELESFAGAGFVFYGHHSAGGDYEAGMFAAHDRELAWVDTGDHAAMPMVEVHPDGFVSGSQLDAAMDYFRVYRAAHYELHRTEWTNTHRPDNPFRLVRWEESQEETLIQTIDGVRIIRV